MKFAAVGDWLASTCGPPGNGWASSSSGAAPLAAQFNARRYGTTDPLTLRDRWIADLRHSAPTAAFVGVPYDRGSYGPNGAASGPLGVRQNLHGLLAQHAGTLVDAGDVPYYAGPAFDEMLSSVTLARARAGRYGDPNAALPVAMLSIHHETIRRLTCAGVTPLTIGGDHTVTASALLGIAKARPVPAIVHIDAHDDCGIGRDGVELLHSSWLRFVDQRLDIPLIFQVGIEAPRPLSRPLRNPTFHQATSEELGASPEALAVNVMSLARECGVTDVYLTVDIDVLRATDAPNTGIPAERGVPVDAVARFIRRLASVTTIVGADVTEVAPILGGDRTWTDEPTCQSAVSLFTEVIHALQTPWA